jgi:hypothetical protein
MCDDISTTITELTGRGVELAGPVQDQDCGLVAMMTVPGTPAMMLHQPKHSMAFSL